MAPTAVVWFQRDLRLCDHETLFEAAARGQVLPVYDSEPELLAQPEHDSQHTRFVLETLAEMAPKLRALGAPLRILTPLSPRPRPRPPWCWRSTGAESAPPGATGEGAVPRRSVPR